MEDILLNIKDLVVSYSADNKKVKAVNGINITIKKGETVTKDRYCKTCKKKRKLHRRGI